MKHHLFLLTALLVMSLFVLQAAEAPTTKPNILFISADDLSDMAKRTIRSEMPSTNWAIENDKWRDIVHAYLVCISFADHQIGRVLEALEKSPYTDNTIIAL
jgi:hypothetical protein